MANAKAQLLEMIAAMPDDSTWSLIAEKIALKASLEMGLEEVEAGRGIPHEQLKTEMREWLRSSGAVMPAKASTPPSHPSIAIPS